MLTSIFDIYMINYSILKKRSINVVVHYSMLLLILFLAAGLEKGFAQADRQVSIIISANVPSSIELLTIQSMDFSGDQITLGPVTIDPIENENAGRMVARGTPNADVQIDYIRIRELRHNQTNNILTLEYSVSGSPEDIQSTSRYIGFDEDDRELRFNEEGELYLWIGASVDLTTAEPGSYEGEFSIVVEYI